MRRVHPIPYQGSKRPVVGDIIHYIPRHVNTIYEPFAGSSALTLACAQSRIGGSYHLNDILSPLMEIWNLVVCDPDTIVSKYRQHWHEQRDNPKQYYNQIRRKFNSEGGAGRLLYLLARCVSNAVRFNSDGEFNQSADHRRMGRHPDRMEREIRDAHELLSASTSISSDDYQNVIDLADTGDLIYMDPPYMGTSQGDNPRYYKSIGYDRLVESLADLNDRNIPYIVSFDGRRGDEEYGPGLPEDRLNLTKINIECGRSNQATLNGRDIKTVESLYLSSNISNSERVQVSQKDVCDDITNLF